MNLIYIHCTVLINGDFLSINPMYVGKKLSDNFTINVKY